MTLKQETKKAAGTVDLTKIYGTKPRGVGEADWALRVLGAEHAKAERNRQLKGE